MSNTGAFPRFPTTSYGSWNSEVNGRQSGPGDPIEKYTAHAEAAWLERFDAEAATDDYVRAINSALPKGVTLQGSDFIGPARDDHDAIFARHPLDENYALDISAIVESIDIVEIIERHSGTPD